MTGRLKQLIWILPLALAGLVAGLGWWGNGRLRATIEDGVQAQLSATLNANVTALGIWATNQTRLATSLAEDPEVRTLASQIFQAPTRMRRDFPTPPELDEFVRDFKPRLPQLGYEVAQLVNTNFIVVANTMRQWPHRHGRGQPDLYQRQVWTSGHYFQRHQPRRDGALQRHAAD